MEPESTPEDPIEERPASTRTAPGPRSAERRTSDRRTSDLRATEQRGDRADPDTAETPASDYRGTSAPRPAPVPVPTNIYRARRPAVALLLIIPAVGVGLLFIRALAISAFGHPFQIDGVIASSSALAALPMLVAGLYGLVTGAAHGAEHYGFKVWARPPLAYLLVGVALVIAAALAIR